MSAISPVEPADAALVRAWIEALNRQDIQTLTNLSAPSIEIHGPRARVQGLNHLLEWLERAGLTLETHALHKHKAWILAEQTGRWQQAESSTQAKLVSAFKIQAGQIIAYARFESLEAALAIS